MIIALSLMASYHTWRRQLDTDAYQRLIDGVNKSDSIEAVVDQHGIIRAWSEGAEWSMGWERDFAIGHGPGFLMTDQEGGVKHHESFDRAMSDFDGAEYHTRLECEIRDTQNNNRLVEITNHVFAIEGKPYVKTEIVEPRSIKRLK